MTTPNVDNEDLAEEIEAINSIYGPSTINLTTTPSAESTISTAITLQIPNHDELSFLVGFEKTYPATTPPRVLGTTSTSGLARGQGKKAVGILEDAVRGTWTEGSVCLFEVIEEVGEKFEELQSESGAGEAGGDYEEKDVYADDGNLTASDYTDALAAQASYDIEHAPDWTISDVISERKSIFVARAVHVESQEEAERCLDHLLATEKKVASATHNITAWRIRQKVKKPSSGGKDATSTTETGTVFQDFDDDGETAAGGRLLHLMQLMDVWDVVVVVTRWFGGVKLGPDRFRLINAAGRDALVKGGFAKKEGPASNNEKGKKKSKK